MKTKLKEGVIQFSVRLPTSFYNEVAEIANKANISLNELVNIALREYLSKNGEK